MIENHFIISVNKNTSNFHFESGNLIYLQAIVLSVRNAVDQ